MHFKASAMYGKSKIPCAQFQSNWNVLKYKTYVTRYNQMLSGVTQLERIKWTHKSERCRSWQRLQGHLSLMSGQRMKTPEEKKGISEGERAWTFEKWVWLRMFSRNGKKDPDENLTENKFRFIWVEVDNKRFSNSGREQT